MKYLLHLSCMSDTLQAYFCACKLSGWLHTTQLTSSFRPLERYQCFYMEMANGSKNSSKGKSAIVLCKMVHCEYSYGKAK